MASLCTQKQGAPFQVEELQGKERVKALYLWVVSLLGGFAGQYGMNWLIKFWKRASIILFLLVFLIVCSVVSLGGMGIVEAIQQLEKREYMGFVQFCS